MIRSMTGFGRAQVAGELLAISVEARSVNHRHLDVNLKLPRLLAAVESQARRLVQSRLDRGRVDINVTATPVAGRTTQEVVIDIPLARVYIDAARRLAADLSLPGAPPLEWILDRPGVVQAGEAEPPAADLIWPLVEQALERALTELVEHRENEGEALGAALRGFHEQIVDEVARVAGRVPFAAARREARFRERLTALLGAQPVDETRVLTEVAVWAEKSDISEELTRLRAHLEQWVFLLKEGGPIGRQLDFLIQEMNREVNTLASKADDLELSQAAIAAKGLLEKAREQVQNLE
jgi:uncharacterized protein (TIGR00255 family)